jgi:pSer/pThr/pTyr-binding forkhead associated (FHA) protein
MSIRLVVKQRSEAGGADKGVEVLLDDDIITLGRDKACEVVLAQQAVSRSHARISRDGSLFFIEDLGSAYGTQINGQTLPKGEKRLLRNGDVIAIAQFDVTFDRLATSAGLNTGGKPTADSTGMIARQVVKDVMKGITAGSEHPFFRVMNGPKEGQKIEIADAQEVVIGRDETADVILKDDLVSRRHVKIRRDWSGTHVEDLESRNGIKVNKKKTVRKTLRDRDELEVGGIRLLYLDPNEVREAPVVLPDEEGEATVQQSKEEAEAEAAEEQEQPAAEEPAAEEPAAEGEAEAPAEGEGEAPAEEGGEQGEEAPAEGEDGEASPEEGEGGEGGEEGDGPKGLLGRLPLGALSNSRALIPIAVTAVIAVIALIMLIAVFAGA